MCELDRNIGIQYCGNEELYESVLEDFYKLIDTKSSKIENLLAEGNIKDYVIEVHALKSNARMIGATKLSEMALEMEMAGKNDDIALINEKTAALMAMYRSYKDKLSYFDKDDVPKVKVPVETVKSELFRMNIATKDFDIDTIDSAMKNLNSYEINNPEAKNKMEELDRLVREVAFQEIKALSLEIAKML